MLDRLDAMDVVTGVVTDQAVCADTLRHASRRNEEKADRVEWALEKQASRDADAHALASGEKSWRSFGSRTGRSHACSLAAGST